MDKLTSVHEALQAATLEKKEDKPMVTTSFKIDAKLREEVQQICERHATDMSSFLRKCCLGLVNDYRS